MSGYRFDGRVAVVTGAGRGLGAAYARLFADRGASVVVNDVGASIDGTGTDDTPARRVVDTITAAGGTAVADTSDIARPDGAEALVARAVETFGAVDVLVNNAGIVQWADIGDMDAALMEHHLAVHTLGSFHTARAVWGHMAARRYGRIVMTTSTGMLGTRGNLAYATAKGGVFGLARALAAVAPREGIAVNLIAPAAFTRMAGGAGDGDTGGAPHPLAAAMAPELVAPMVAYLAHETCPVNGEMYAAGAGRFARLFVASTPGWVAGPAPARTDGPDGTGPASGDSSLGPTVEDVAAHWAEINDESGYLVPTDLDDWSASFCSHLDF